jgi:prephenate dehydratase
MKVAFQGELGAYSHEAVRAVFGDQAQPLPKPTFRATFEALWRGEADRALVPLENSHAGTVTEPCDLLLEKPVHLVGERAMPIHHCLLALPGERFEDLRAVWSHPQALAQCTDFLARNGLTAVAEYDTAGSAKKLAKERPKATGAIASRTAGALYGLAVLAENIETAADNATRFVAVSREPGGGGAKTSIAFTLPEQPGALHTVLGILASRGLEVVRLISRPRGDAAWRYVFHLDFVGSPDAALAELGARTARLWVLGSY